MSKKEIISRTAQTVDSVNQIVDSVAAFIKSVVPPTMNLIEPEPIEIEKPVRAKKVVRIPRKTYPSQVPDLKIDSKKTKPAKPPVDPTSNPGY